MVDFDEKVCGHFRNKNFSTSQFEDRLLNCMTMAASAGPALANAAMLVAQGCLRRYTETLGALYTANNLQCPDFGVLFDQHVTESPRSEYHSVPEESKDSDGIQSILRHIEDVEELPASVNEVLDILTNFDTF